MRELVSNVGTEMENEGSGGYDSDAMAEFENKVVVVTGGTSGIGLATAQAFARSGARVVITGRNRGRLDRARDRIEGEVLALESDQSRLTDIDAMLARTRETYGPIDVLFLNAGISRIAPIEAVTESLFDEIVDTNFKGVYFTIQRSLPYSNRPSAIVLNSSISGFVGQHSLSVYSATKAALRSLAKTLATELGPRGVRINVVSPGYIDTPIAETLGMTPEATATFFDAVAARCPARRGGTSEDVAAAVLFLASSEASYVVGSEIVVDGGYTIVTHPI
jgi:NAD(P)-dependent dehydrogenase (short-subunit alcohol dehydrogenase family)